jgi:hypothetical protein
MADAMTMMGDQHGSANAGVNHASN